MSLHLIRVPYADLNARQKENRNFQKVSGLLADYGFSTIRLSDDWHGADFLAQHIDGERFLRVQLKGRLTFHIKYTGKDLFVAFEDAGEWYLYPHDDLLALVLDATDVGNTKSWKEHGGYSFPSVTSTLQPLLSVYVIPAV